MCVLSVPLCLLCVRCVRFVYLHVVSTLFLFNYQLFSLNIINEALGDHSEYFLSLILVYSEERTMYMYKNSVSVERSILGLTFFPVVFSTDQSVYNELIKPCIYRYIL